MAIIHLSALISFSLTISLFSLVLEMKQIDADDDDDDDLEDLEDDNDDVESGAGEESNYISPLENMDELTIFSEAFNRAFSFFFLFFD
jgi:hypothetical protein